jgi:hypothetical protein
MIILFDLKYLLKPYPVNLFSTPNPSPPQKLKSQGHEAWL